MKKGNVKETRLIVIMRWINKGIDALLVFVLILVLLFNSYAVWDTYSLVESARATVYDTYNPAIDKSAFEYLQGLNDEVIGWLNVYGTSIDYPIVQGPNNDKYMTRNPLNEYSAAGSLFLEAGQSPNFTSFKNIIYGHHMDASAMFGDIALFKDETFFMENKSGEIYFQGKFHKIAFFAFLEVDVYNSFIYQSIDETQRDNYIQQIQEEALNIRNMKITTQDQLVLLSTCTSDMTSGRHILVGKIEQTFKHEKTIKSNSIKISLLVFGLFFIGGLLFVVGVFMKNRKGCYFDKSKT